MVSLILNTIYLILILVLKIKLKFVNLNNDQNYRTHFWITVKVCCLLYLKLGYEK